mmetsp:Transcript_4406/g.9632  ORF Transcript_4406/g.9632 Transcript_4406/m.9632 type:complete len:237 (+) Transcript_4406:1148-1858(+)
MEVAGGRHHHTAGPLDRLSDEGGHALSPALASDGVVKLLRETLHEVGLALVWQALAVEGGARDVMGADGLQRQPHRRVHVRQARERAGRHRDAVVATIAREQLRLVRQPTRVVVRPQETDLRVVRIRPRLAEEDASVLQPRGRARHESVGKLVNHGYAAVGEAVVVCQRAHLRRRRLDELLVAPAQRHAPEATHAFEVCFALIVHDVVTLCRNYSKRRELACQVGHRRNQRVAREQ